MALLTDQFVGRAEELGSFDQALGEVDQGVASAIELVGEPGIGKTRLLAEFAVVPTSAGGSSFRARRRSSSATCRSPSSWTRSTSTCAGSSPDRLAVLGRRRPHGALARLPFAVCARDRERWRSSTSATAVTGRCARCSSTLRRRGRSCSCSTTSTGPTRPPSNLLGALLRARRAGVLIAVAVRPHQMPERSAPRSNGRTARGRDPDRARALTALEARELLGERSSRRRDSSTRRAAETRSISSSSRGRSTGRPATATPEISRAPSASHPPSPPR